MIMTASVHKQLEVQLLLRNLFKNLLIMSTSKTNRCFASGHNSVLVFQKLGIPSTTLHMPAGLPKEIPISDSLALLNLWPRSTQKETDSVELATHNNRPVQASAFLMEAFCFPGPERKFFEPATPRPEIP